jgi:diaminopimelate epimerase
MRFSKYHGTRNDFVLIGDPDGLVELTPDLIVAMCDRRGGVGADGLIRVVTGPAAAARGLAGPEAADADFFMDHHNADGRPAEMCGNGIRCLAKFVFDRGLTSSRRLEVMTRAGLKHLVLAVEDGRVERVTVDMGRPELDVARIPMVGEPGTTFVGRPFEGDGRTWTATAVSMGNPHLVLMASPGEDLEAIDLERLGPHIEGREEFPNGTNVEIVKVLDDSSIRMRVWERGVGLTAACGTGACAALVACSLAGLVGRAADVRLPGGSLSILWRDDDRVLMAGPATWVFDGELSGAWLAAAGAGEARKVDEGAGHVPGPPPLESVPAGAAG